MDISGVSYKVQSYIVSDLDRGLTEDDIKVFYENQEYNVYKNYKSKILDTSEFPINKYQKFSREVENLFCKYSRGYPDFLLEKDGKYSFVEVKLDGDKLSPAQVFFCNELVALGEDVSVAYFNVLDRLENENFVGTKSLGSLQKNVLVSCEKLKTKAIMTNKKPLWVVAELYKTFGQRMILSTKLLPLISSSLNVPKTTIKWFVDFKLNPDGKKLEKELKQAKKEKAKNIEHRNFKEARKIAKFRRKRQYAQYH